MLRSTHLKHIQALHDSYAEKLGSLNIRYAMLGDYYKHICELHKEQIEDLRKLVFVKTEEVPESLREVDRALTQNQEIPFPDVGESFRDLAERDALLNGTWDEVMPN